MARKKKSAPTDNADASKGTKRKRDIDWADISEDTGFGGFQLKPIKQSKRQKPGTPQPTKDYKHMPMTALVAQANPFKGTELSATFFEIVPKAHWESPEFKRYAKFTVEQDTYHVGDMVYILAEAEQNNSKAPISTWAAKVLEIRGANANNVYLRIYWMYRPEDLPGGRQPYHGRNELIASNDMAIIHARTVDGPADVIQWKEDTNSAELLDPQRLFWRQTVDVTKHPAVLSELPRHCIDKMPWNPDEPLIQCDGCQEWLHSSCLEDAALRKVYKEHNLGFPEKPRGKKGSKKVAIKAPSAFKVQVEVKDNGQTHMTITDLREGPTKATTTSTPIYCLLCDAAVDDGKPKHDIVDGEPSSAGIHVNSSLLGPATPPNQPDEEDGEEELENKAITDSSPTLVQPQDKPLGFSPTTAHQTAIDTEQSPPPSPFKKSALRRLQSVTKLLTGKP